MINMSGFVEKNAKILYDCNDDFFITDNGKTLYRHVSQRRKWKYERHN